MKKLCCFCILLLLLTLTGCGESETATTKSADSVTANEAVTSSTESASTDLSVQSSVDVDLTKLSSTMVYSEVYNMMNTPNSYIGKTVRMTGTFVAYSNQDKSQYYPAVIIADATACCSQGLEFVLKGDKAYPDDYPPEQTEITVTGTFETYYEGEDLYCHLVDATLA